MKLKETHMDALSEMFSYTEDIDELKSREEVFNNYQKDHLIFNGKEAEILFSAFRNQRARPGLKLKRDDWFENELNQELFQSDPWRTISNARSFCGGNSYSRYGSFLPKTNKEGYEEMKRWGDIERHFQGVQGRYEESISFLTKLKRYRTSNSFFKV